MRFFIGLLLVIYLLVVGLTIFGVWLKVFPNDVTPIASVRNCYQAALSAYWYGGAAALRGEDPTVVHSYVAAAVQFDPELAALWERAFKDKTAWQIFAALLQAKAWAAAPCPPTNVGTSALRR